MTRPLQPRETFNSKVAQWQKGKDQTETDWCAQLPNINLLQQHIPNKKGIYTHHYYLEENTYAHTPIYDYEAFLLLKIKAEVVSVLVLLSK